MTEDKLYKFLKDEYLKVPEGAAAFNMKAELAGWKIDLSEYESSIIKECIKIILTNFTLTDKNAHH